MKYFIRRKKLIYFLFSHPRKNNKHDALRVFHDGALFSSPMLSRALDVDAMSV